MTLMRHTGDTIREASGRCPGASVRGGVDTLVRQAAYLSIALLLCAGCSPFDARRAHPTADDSAAAVSGARDGEPEGDAPARGPVVDEPTPDVSYVDGEAVIRSGGPILRVGLARERQSVVVSGRGACVLILYGETTRLVPGGADSRWTVREDERGLLVGGTGIDDVTAGTVRLRPEAEAPVEIDGVAYRGEIEIYEERGGGISAANIIDLESYLRGVVPREIGARPLEELEAVKAQAVAARTYAMARGGGRGDGDFDLHATVDDQAYAGYDGEHAVSDRAIAETAGLVVWNGDGPVNAYFSSCCGGRTAARHEVWELPAEEHLVVVNDTPGGSRDLDSAYCRNSKHFTWTEEWKGSDLAAMVDRYLPDTASTPVRGDLGELRDLRVVERTPSGRVRWLEVETTGGAYRVYGDRTRWLLRRPGTSSILRSAWFELDVHRRRGVVTRVTAEGRGHGHGVGLCQHGAMGMALRGYDFRQILEHYYPGTSIRTPAGYWERP